MGFVTIGSQCLGHWLPLFGWRLEIAGPGREFLGMQPVHRVAVETMVVGLAWFVLLSGCAAREPLPPEEPPATRNIASQVLPGQWQVVDESVVFTFDDQGIPLSIRNDADPQDSRTNVVFGEPATIAAPIGRIDIVFLPTEPSIDEQTGEAALCRHRQRLAHRLHWPAHPRHRPRHI